MLQNGSGWEGFLEKGRSGSATPKDGGVSWKEVRDSSLEGTWRPGLWGAGAKGQGRGAPSVLNVLPAPLGR